MVTGYRLIGGDPALDLANTLEGPIDAEPDTDHLGSYEDLTDWAVRAGVLGEATAARLAGDREAALARVHALRDAVYEVFAAVARDRPPQRLGELEAAYAGAVARARLVSRRDPAEARAGFSWAWDDDADRVLWAVAVAAVDLLRTGPLERVKLCAHCRWLFVDASRNRSRRWCSMNECGGNDKMRRYRARRATAGR